MNKPKNKNSLVDILWWNNKHTPREILSILSKKGYEIFEWDIDQNQKQNQKPILLYIPNNHAYHTINEILNKGQKVLFMLLSGYNEINENTISWSLKSVAYIYDQKKKQITRKVREFPTNSTFYIKDWESWALLVRKSKNTWENPEI